MNKKVKDVMTSEVVWVSPEVSLHDAFQKMRKNDIRHLPVISRKNKNIIGMLSEGDIILYLQKNGPSLEMDSRVLVGDAMSKDVVFCYPNSKAVNVAATMITAKIDSVPVIDAKTDHLVGIITTTDLLDEMCLRFELDGGNIRPLKYKNPNSRLQRNVTRVN